MGDETQTQDVVSTINAQSNDFYALNLRLNPDPLLARTEMYLRGAKIEYIETPQGIQGRKVNIGVPLANNFGVQQILNRIGSIINPQVVQGNFPSDDTGYSFEYEYYIREVRYSIAEFLFINLDNFEIDEAQYEGICDFIMDIVIPFMSRLIDNKERDSYGKVSETNSSNTVRAKNGIPLFNNQKS
jgi:hypothetical protein